MVNWQQKINNGTKRLLDPLLDGKDNLAMQALAPFSKAYLPWSQYAMRPSGIVKILNEILINQRFTVVECGAGLTTFYIASLMQQQDKGHLYSIEHDAAWLEVVRSLLAVRGLESYVTFIHAPLVDCELSLEGTAWYDRQAIDQAIQNQNIDLLVIDGPPAFDRKRRYARYPAPLYLQSYFAENYTIILDDINREGEQHILQQWQQKFPKLQVQPMLIDGGVAICTNKKGFSIG
jgi:hypothetical protein